MKNKQDLFYESVLNTLKSVATTLIEQEYSLINDLSMTGWAFKINENLNMITDTKLKEKIEKECDEIWGRWYAKVKEEQLTPKNLSLLNAFLES